MSHEKSHPIIDFLALLAEYVVAWHKGTEFERVKAPPRWARRLRLITFPIWWLISGLFMTVFIGIIILLAVLSETVPALIDKFKEAWNNV